MIERLSSAPQLEYKRVFEGFDLALQGLDYGESEVVKMGEAALFESLEEPRVKPISFYFDRLAAIGARVLSDPEKSSTSLVNALEAFPVTSIGIQHNYINYLVQSGVVDGKLASVFIHHAFSPKFGDKRIHDAAMTIYRKILNISSTTPEPLAEAEGVATGLRSTIRAYVKQQRDLQGLVKTENDSKDRLKAYIYPAIREFTYFSGLAARFYFTPRHPSLVDELAYQIHGSILKMGHPSIYLKRMIEANRDDALTLYVPRNEMALGVALSIVETVLKKQRHLLADHSILTGVSLSDGLTLAIEPDLISMIDIHTEHQVGVKPPSYNSLMALVFLISNVSQDLFQLSPVEAFNQSLLLMAYDPGTLFPVALSGGDFFDAAKALKNRFGA